MNMSENNGEGAVNPGAGWLAAALSWSRGLGMEPGDITQQLQHSSLGFGLPREAAEVVVAEMTNVISADNLRSDAEFAARRAAVVGGISPLCPHVVRDGFLRDLDLGMRQLNSPHEWVQRNGTRLGWSDAFCIRAAGLLGANAADAARAFPAWKPGETRDDGGWRVED